MSTKLEQLNYLEKCLQQYLNYLCSKAKLLSFNKKKKKKNNFLNKLFKEWKMVYHQLIQQTKNGIRNKEINKEENKIKQKEFKENN